MTATPLFNRAGMLWQQRISGMHEYEFVREGNVFSAGFSQSFVFSSEYEAARQLLATLLSQYQGRNFDSVFCGRDEVNSGGVCFAHTSRHDLSFHPFDTGRFRDEVEKDLSLVHGIGPATGKKLNARGYLTLNDLCRHPHYCHNAKDVLTRISGGNTLEIMNLIGGRHSRSHRSVLGTAAMHEPEDFVFFDIETLGLFGRPIILFGIGSVENEKLCVTQYLLRDIDEEEAALLATVSHLSGDHPALVTFNGKSFDLPYLTDRLAYYGLGSPVAIPHFDMLHFSRRRWKGELSSLRLTALEKAVLEIKRKDDIPGQMVPEFYEAYQRSGNCGPLVPILDHNRQDVVSLARLFFHLMGESYGCT